MMTKKYYLFESLNAKPQLFDTYYLLNRYSEKISDDIFCITYIHVLHIMCTQFNFYKGVPI